MKTSILWRLYLGGKDGGHGSLKRDVWEVMKEFVSGCTIYPATGYWHRKIEETWIIEMTGSRELVDDVVAHLKKVFKQSAIMVVALGKTEIL